MFAARKGIRDAGVADNDVLIFSGLMDANSLFLTANADTDLLLQHSRPDQGAAGGRDAARHARAVRRHVVPLGHRLRHARPRSRAKAASICWCRRAMTGPLPEGGYFIGRSTTTSVALLGRAFLENNDPATGGRRDQEVAQDLSVHARAPTARASARFLHGQGAAGAARASRRRRSSSRAPASS